MTKKELETLLEELKRQNLWIYARSMAVQHVSHAMPRRINAGRVWNGKLARRRHSDLVRQGLEMYGKKLVSVSGLL